MRQALAHGLVEVEWSGRDGVTGAHDHDRLVTAAIGEAGHLAMARRDPPLPAAIEDRVGGDQAAVFEDLHLVGERVHLDDPLPGGIRNAVEIAADAHHPFMGDPPFQFEHRAERGERQRAQVWPLPKIESAGSSERFLERLGSMSRVLTRVGLDDGVRTPGRPGGRRSRFTSKRGKNNWNTGIFALDSVQRLALEMALHEETERAALQGELAALETAWRDAEEIAGISDSLLVPSDVDAKFTKLKGE